MLVLPASVTTGEARDTLRMLAQALPREGDAAVVVDAGALDQLDTSAIAVLLECRRQAQSLGRGFEVRRAPDKLVSLAKLYGVSGLLQLGA